MLSAPIGSGTGGPRPPVAPPNAGAPATISLHDLLAARHPSLAPFLDQVPPSIWTRENAAVATFLHHPTAENAERIVYLGGPIPQNVIVIVGVVVAGYCVGALVSGIGAPSCLGAVAVVGVMFLINFLLGQSAASANGQAVTNFAKYLVSNAAQRWNQQADSASTDASALNTSQSAFGYAAAAAALLQLPNATFNVPLDLAQSSVAAQLGSELWADGNELAQIEATTMNDFNLIEGSANTVGTYCGSTDSSGNLATGAAASLLSPAPLPSTCPITGSASTFSYGSVYSSLGYVTVANTTPTACRAVYLLTGEGFALSSATLTNFRLNLYAVGGGYRQNYSVVGTHSATNITFTGGTGGYYVCSANGTAVTFWPTVSFPLNSASQPSGPASLIWVANGATNDEYGQGTALLLQGCQTVSATNLWSACIDGTYVANSVTLHGPRSSQTTLEGSLWNLASYAGSVGQAYWTFLRTLGYTSVSQIPPNCIIPPPSSILPPNFNVQTISAVNASALYQLYLAYLYKLGVVFNSSTSLTSANFCGKHATISSNFLVQSFGVYATGWIFVNGATKDSNGTSVSQTFGNKVTWNQSGVIFLGPSIAPETIVLNTTWIMPNKNPTVIMVEPFTNGSGRLNTYVNVNGPTNCFKPRAIIPNGCNTTGYHFTVDNLVVGNSSNLNGSVYPTQQVGSPSAGYSVYLTGCWVANTNVSFTNPTYVFHGSTCTFGLSTFRGDFSNWSGPSTGAIFIGATACGQTLPIWATFVAAVATITGQSALGCLVAEAIAAILLAVLIAIIVAVVSAIVRRRN